MKKLNTWIISSIILLLALIATNITIIKASGGISDSDGLAAAPTGVNIGFLSQGSLFTQGSSTTLPSTVKSGHVVEIINGGNQNQVSSIWSNPADGIDNYFDAGKKQTLSAWIFMGGSSYHGSEGLVFVLQNSGPKAIAMNGNNIAGGESLGVWGSDLKKRKNSSAMALTAIQNSWALEFDGVPTGSQDGNAVYGKTVVANPGETLDSYQKGVNNTLLDFQGNSLNRGFKEMWGHLAWSYPGDKDAYLNIGTYNYGNILPDNGPIYELVHNDIDETDFVTPSSAALAWHHLTVTYTPPEAGSTNATLKYVFNDKTIEGLEPPSEDRDQQLITRELKLDLSKLNATTGTKLYYGFVGTNSIAMNSATNAVVFEELPSLVEADKNAYVVDETNKTKVSSSTDVMKDNDKTLTETTTVHPNDQLRFNYMLEYQSGKRDMLPVTATVNVPDNVTVTPDSSGNIGQVTYANANSEPIPASALKDTEVTDKKTGKTSTVKMLTFTIANSLSLTNPWANIELNATADPVPNVNTALQVPLSHATLEGDNYKTDVQTPPFTIQAARATLTLTKTSDDVITTSPDHSVDLTGTMKIVENDTPNVEQPINNSDINFYVSVDGGDAQLVKDTASPNGHFAIPFNSTDENEHIITVYAVDPNYVGSDGIPDTLASNKVTYTVKVKKNDLSLVSKDEYDFQFVRADEKERIIPRKDDWDVEVNSTNTTWVLTANSTELVDENNDTFNGGLVFTDESGNTSSLQDGKVLIDEDMTASPTQEITKVSDEWDSDEGVLLHVNSGVVPSGKYTGTIYWNLSDSITQ